MSLDIVFMGTPDFAVPSLQALIDSEHRIVGVFSQPDRPRGRSQELVPPEVKQLAVEHDLPVFQPETLKDGTATQQLQKLNPDIVVVAAYGQILPKEMLDIPRLGCINVHGSLLPALRGAGPVNWSIINGDSETGITIMYMAEGMDTGDIIYQQSTPIGSEETAGQLFDRLSHMGARVLMEALPSLADGTATRTPQDHSKATYAPMLNRKMAEIDFSKTATQVANWIRGLNPWPSAWTTYNDMRLIVHQAQVVDGSGKPGEILDETQPIIACGQGAVKITSIQVPGRQRCDGVSFCHGRDLCCGEKFISPSHS